MGALRVGQESPSKSQTSQATAVAIPEFEEVPIAENTGLGETELDLTQRAPLRTSLGVQEVIHKL